MSKRKRTGTQRERKIKHSNFLDVYVFPVFPKARGRSKKRKPSTEIQKKLNQKYRENKLKYLLNVNFTNEDMEIRLGYDDEYLPADYKQCQKDVANFHRRLNRFRIAVGLPPLKYIYCIERGEKGGRFHVHDTMSGGTVDTSDETIKRIKPFFRGKSEDEIKADIKKGGYKQCVKMLWGKGYTHTDDLDFDDDGLKSLAKYKVKEPQTAAAEIEGKVRRWSTSKNLIQPEIKERDNYISAATVEEIRKGDISEREIERLYPDYTLTGYEAMHNNINAGEYLVLYLRRTKPTRTAKEVFRVGRKRTVHTQRE